MAKNLTFLLLAAALVVLPLWMYRGAEGAFVGTDNRACEAIVEIAPGYRPWCGSLWAPPTPGVERALFGVQAAAGAAVLCYGMARLMARGRGDASR